MYSQRFALSLEVASQLLSGFFNLTRCCHLSATAYLLYHTVNRLSTTFLFFFRFFRSGRSRFVSDSQSAWLVYLVSTVLSTTFFDFFKSFSQPENFHFRGGVSYYHIAPCFVNNFLHLFFKAFTQWWKWRKKRNLNLLRFFFYFLLVVNGERGIWTLAPVARPTPLAGAPLQPLEYFSMNRTSSLPICYWRHFVTQKLLYISSMLLSIAFFIIFLLVDIVYEYCRIASSIFVFTMSAISGVFNCLYSS